MIVMNPPLVAYGRRNDDLRSRTRDWEPGITRSRVIGAAGTRICQTDFSAWWPILQQIVRYRLSFGGCPMADAQNRAERYRDLAEEYRRLSIASSTEMRARYLRMAEHYGRLAEAEELSAQGRKNSD